MHSDFASGIHILKGDFLEFMDTRSVGSADEATIVARLNYSSRCRHVGTPITLQQTI